MKKYLALLRGINVGGNNKVEMKKLKLAFEAAGFAAVRTYINSGNVMFESAEGDLNKLENIIKKLLQKTCGFAIGVVIREQADLQKIAKLIPHAWQNDKEQKTDILFLWKDFDNKNSLKLIKAVAGVDDLIYVSGAIVWHVKRENYNKSAMHKFAGTPLYKNMTARNVNTVRRLVKLMI